MDEDRTDYETVLIDGHAVLAHKPNGDCVYLGASGCTIYEKRPLMCRRFDCADMVRKMPKSVLRKWVRDDPRAKPVIDRGKQLWRDGYRPDGWKEIQAARREVIEKGRIK